MDFLKKNQIVLYLLFFLIVFVGCKENESEMAISMPFPENDDFSIIKTTSLEGRDTISIYEGKVIIDLKLPLDVFTSIDTTEFKYKIKFKEAILKSDNSFNVENSVSDQKIELFFNKLSPSTNYSLNLYFEIENENQEIESVERTLDINTYDLPTHYSGQGFEVKFGENNKQELYKLPALEFLFPPNQMITIGGINFKSDIEFEIKNTDGQQIETAIHTNDRIGYFYKKNQYLFKPGVYNLSMKQVYYEEIRNSWIKTDSAVLEVDFEILPNDIEVVKLQYPSNGTEIFRNQNFIYELNDLDLSDEFFNKIQIVLDSVIISNPSGGTFNSNLFQENGFYRIRSFENFIANDSIMVSGLFKYKLINDTIDFIYPEQVGSLMNQFYVNNAFTTVISKEDFSASYPIPRQRNFLIDEFYRGGFQFNSVVGIEDYFDASRNYEVLFIKDKDTLKTTANWNETDLTFKFDLPSGLETYSIYNYQIFDNSVNGLLFSDYFKTSKYRTFIEKLDPNNTPTSSGSKTFKDFKDFPDGNVLKISFFPDEVFDFAEANFRSGRAGLLTDAVLSIEDIEWYNNNFYDSLYSNIDRLPFQINYRDNYEYNTPPNNSLYTINYNYKLNDSEINAGIPNSYSNNSKIFSIDCLVESIILGDYQNLKEQAETYNGEENQYITHILNSNFQRLTEGFYEFDLYYKIPIYEVETTRKSYRFYCPF